MPEPAMIKPFPMTGNVDGFAARSAFIVAAKPFPMASNVIPMAFNPDMFDRRRHRNDLAAGRWRGINNNDPCTVIAMMATCKEKNQSQKKT